MGKKWEHRAKDIPTLNRKRLMSEADWRKAVLNEPKEKLLFNVKDFSTSVLNDSLIGGFEAKDLVKDIIVNAQKSVLFQILEMLGAENPTENDLKLFKKESTVDHLINKLYFNDKPIGFLKHGLYSVEFTPILSSK